MRIVKKTTLALLALATATSGLGAATLPETVRQILDRAYAKTGASSPAPSAGAPLAFELAAATPAPAPTNPQPETPAPTPSPAPAPAPATSASPARAGGVAAFPVRDPREVWSNAIATLRAQGRTNEAAELERLGPPGSTNIGGAATTAAPAAVRSPAPTQPRAPAAAPDVAEAPPPPPPPIAPSPAAPAAPAPKPTPTPAPAIAPAAVPPAGPVAGARPGPGAAAPAPLPGPAAVTAAAARPGGPNDPDADIIPAGMIKFQDVGLSDVLTIYQELTGRTVLRPSNLPDTKITIKTQTDLTRREAVLALDSILSMNGITMIPQGDKFVKAVPQAQSHQEANRFYAGTAEELPEAGQLVTYIAYVTNAPLQDVGNVLQQFAKMPGSSIIAIPPGTLVIRDYAENVKRMVEVLRLIDVAVPREYESIVIPIKYALASDIANVLGSLTTGGGVTTVGQQQTRTGLTTGAPGVGAPGTGTVPGLPGYTPSPTPAGATRAGLGSPAAARSSFAERLRGIVARAAAAAAGEIVVLGQTKIIADERTNSLLIYASKEDIETIKDIISKLDVVLAQVLIESLIFEVSLDDNLSYGISYLQRKPTTRGDFTGIGAIKNIGIPTPLDFTSTGTGTGTGVGTGTGTGGVGANLPAGFSYLARWGDFDIAAQAIATDSRVNVLSRPRIQTSHAVEANLFVGQTRPYPMGTSYGGYYGGYSSIQQLQIGITLSVLPLINPDGLVVMDIRQRIQTIGGEVEIANVGKVPETIDREANAKVAVRDRETVVLGGFISAERRKSASGVPLLKDIPLLGNLFRSTSKSANRKELMILIRPTVLPSPADAALAAAEEKVKMPGVHKLDQEVRKEEQAAQDKARRELLKREGLPY